ncbi:M81 family metallopeptidase [Sinorhizobium meliloti]|uniref:M81 family metallopeptidase n=1 Tax=Rhizobium meliloti TaxID=382 RepID=UPI0013E40A8B|nr:M81 family metallopeptidase [Sinorhizobium meliloti]
MKILFGMLVHESNSFASGAGDFKGISVGEELFSIYRNKVGYLAGMINAAEENGVELIPSVAAGNTGPRLTKEAVEYTVGELVTIAEKRKGEYNGICLALHGAGVAENADDLEAYIMKKVREVVGPDMPITVSLDLHGNISPELAKLSNGLFGCKQYPHVDEADAGHLAMKTLIRILRGEATPQTAVVQLPWLVDARMGNTFVEPMKSVTDYVADYAAKHGLIDAAFFHGYGYSDVPFVGASVVVVAEKGAEKAAADIARHIWEKREQLRGTAAPMPDVAVDHALAALEKPGTGYVVIVEISDNPGAGAPGTGTHLLREVLRRDPKKAIFGFICDPEIALLAHKVGVGGVASGLLGGKTDEIHGAPIELHNAKVCALSDGNATYVSPMMEGLPVCYGKTARLRVGNVDIIVTEQPDAAYDDRPFLITGADINQYEIVCIKGTNHFRAFFDPRAKAVVATDPPGVSSKNFGSFNYQKIRRPIYPIDFDTTFSV